MINYNYKILKNKHFLFHWKIRVAIPTHIKIKNHAKIFIRKRIQNIPSESVLAQVDDNNALCGIGYLSFGGEYGCQKY